MAIKNSKGRILRAHKERHERVQDACVYCKCQHRTYPNQNRKSLRWKIKFF